MKTATEMTSQELRDAARTYDRVNNEGGEGYNPYTQELERGEHEELRKQAKAHAETPQGKIDALYRRIELECGSVAREWGNSEEIDALQSSLCAAIDNIKAEIDAEFLKTWTLEITKARRQEWNSWVRAELGTSPMTPDKMRMLHNRQQTQGWSTADLRKAIALHNIN